MNRIPAKPFSALLISLSVLFAHGGEGQEMKNGRFDPRYAARRAAASETAGCEDQSATEFFRNQTQVNQGYQQEPLMKASPCAHQVIIDQVRLFNRGVIKGEEGRASLLEINCDPLHPRTRILARGLQGENWGTLEGKFAAGIMNVTGCEGSIEVRGSQFENSGVIQTNR